MNDVEGIVCEHYPNPPPNTPRKFVLKPRTYTATVSVPFSREVKSSQLRIGNVKAKQFGVNTNFATTYHKMQVRLGKRVRGDLFLDVSPIN